MAVLQPFMLLHMNQLTSSSTTGGASTFALNSNNDWLAFVFQVETTDPITRVVTSVSARTGTQPTYQVSLQGLTSAGMPDTVIKSSGGALNTWATTATGNQQRTLNSSYTATMGEFLALVLEYSSGTIGASNFSTWRRGYGGEFASPGFPYACTRTDGAAYVKTASGSEIACFGYGTATKWYGRPVDQWVSSLVESISGRRVTMKFTIPRWMASSFRVAGWWYHGRPTTSTTVTFKFGIWDEAGAAVCGPFDMEPELLGIGSGTAFALQERLLFPTSSLPLLQGGVTYYMGFQATGSAVLIEYPTSSVQPMSWQPFGADAMTATWDGSTWTPFTLGLPVAALLISEWNGAPSIGRGTSRGTN